MAAICFMMSLSLRVISGATSMLLLGSEVKVTSYLALLVLKSSSQSPAMGHGQAAWQRGQQIAPRSWPDLDLINIPTPEPEPQLAARLVQSMKQADESRPWAMDCNFQ